MGQLNEVKNDQQSVKQTVMNLLGWDDLKYGEFQMEMGYEYLSREIGADVWGIDQLSKSSMFWAWWINHWLDRDVRFIAVCFRWNTYEERVQNYINLHSPDGFRFRPHRAVLASAYDSLVNDLTGRGHK